jgi:hypothetical protein
MRKFDWSETVLQRAKGREWRRIPGIDDNSGSNGRERGWMIPCVGSGKDARRLHLRFLSDPA